MNNEFIGYQKKYQERKALYKTFGYDVDKEREFILEVSHPVTGKILEAGTGKGHFALTLAKAGYSFITFDISPEEQRFAKLNIACHGFEKQVDFRIENGEKTSFSSGSYDTIISVNLLHHLKNAYLVIDELLRLLSPEGKIIVADFTEEGFRLLDKIHKLEGNTHETGEVGLEEAETYLAGKGRQVRRMQSIYQCVLVSEKRGVKT